MHPRFELVRSPKTPAPTPLSHTVAAGRGWQRAAWGRAAAAEAGAAMAPLVAPHVPRGPALELKWDDIVAATDGFSERNLLGDGAFGPVYSGKLFNKGHACGGQAHAPQGHPTLWHQHAPERRRV